MKFISQNLELLLILSLVLNVFLLLGLAFLFLKFKEVNKKIKVLLSGKKGQDLEGLLNEIFEKTKTNIKEIEKINTTLSHLNRLAEKGIQKVGVVRFNPFKDTGGDLSFSLALLDYYNNGVVISSLHGREETRIYAKPIINGKSEYNLSDEEKQALKKAMEEKN